MREITAFLSPQSVSQSCYRFTPFVTKDNDSDGHPDNQLAILLPGPIWKCSNKSQTSVIMTPTNDLASARTYKTRATLQYPQWGVAW
jgi:hypothetical protein